MICIRRSTNISIRLPGHSHKAMLLTTLGYYGVLWRITIKSVTINGWASFRVLGYQLIPVRLGLKRK